MSEQNQPENKDPQTPTGALLSLPSARLAEVQNAFPRSHRSLAIAAMAIAVIAGAIVLYMWKELEQERTASALGQDALSDRIVDLEKANNQRHAELEQARQGTEETARQNQAIRGTIDELRTRVTRDRGAWLLAETDFLLSTANRQLQFDHDVTAAIAAFQEADERLQMLRDPSLVQVRSAIARNVQQLRRVPVVNRTDLALQLSALIAQSDELPLVQGLAAPTVASATPTQERPAASGWRGALSDLWSDIKGLVTVRRLNQPVVPMLPPDQRFFLRANLALKLETARIALLQRDPIVYQSALKETGEWLDRYFDNGAPSVHTAIEAVNRLRAAEIAPALPDVGDSLRQLRRIKHELDAEVRMGGTP